MTDPQHDRIRALFAEAIELPVAARQAFLRGACRGDAALQQRVLAMLAGAEDDRFLAAPTGQLPAASALAASAATAEVPGTKVFVDLYSAWERLEPGAGRAAKAAEWQAKLESLPK